MRKSKSDIQNAVLETASGLHKAGILDQVICANRYGDVFQRKS